MGMCKYFLIVLLFIGFVSQGQPMKMLTKKVPGVQFGADLLEGEGSFTSSTGWTLATGYTIGGGKLTVTGAAAFSSIYNNTYPAFVSGHIYQLDADIVFTSGLGKFSVADYLFNTTAERISFTEHKAIVFTYTTGASNVFIFDSGGNSVFTIDNLTIREKYY